MATVTVHEEGGGESRSGLELLLCRLEVLGHGSWKGLYLSLSLAFYLSIAHEARDQQLLARPLLASTATVGKAILELFSYCLFDRVRLWAAVSMDGNRCSSVTRRRDHDLDIGGKLTAMRVDRIALSHSGTRTALIVCLFRTSVATAQAQMTLRQHV